jgi:hypothetical protein
MSSKYHALLKSKSSSIEYEMAKDSAMKHAAYLVEQLNKGSEWLQIDCIKQLKYFIEFDFVRKNLINKHNSKNSSSKIKEAIMALYNNELDTSDLDEKISIKKKELSFN